MIDKKTERPPEGTPEFKEWLKKQTAKDVEEMFGDDRKSSSFDEVGILSGDEDLLDKSDAELFPDELEEYSPEERRKNFKIHKRDEK